MRKSPLQKVSQYEFSGTAPLAPKFDRYILKRQRRYRYDDDNDGHNEIECTKSVIQKHLNQPRRELSESHGNCTPKNLNKLHITPSFKYEFSKSAPPAPKFDISILKKQRRYSCDDNNSDNGSENTKSVAQKCLKFDSNDFSMQPKRELSESHGNCIPNHLNKLHITPLSKYEFSKLAPPAPIFDMSTYKFDKKQELYSYDDDNYINLQQNEYMKSIETKTSYKEKCDSKELSDSINEIDFYSPNAKKLMKKLGWCEGKGLGKCENGILKPIIPEGKYNTRGLDSSDFYHSDSEPDDILHNGEKYKNSCYVPKGKLTREQENAMVKLNDLAIKRFNETPTYVLDKNYGSVEHKCLIYKIVLKGKEYKPSIPGRTKAEAKAIAAKYCWYAVSRTQFVHE